jgi:acetoacetate decarboxylase
MVLKGKTTGASIPFDAPLYEFNPDRGIEYRNCEALAAVFMIDGQIDDILPKGLEPFSDPPQGAIWISRYSYSTVGTYNEHISLIIVRDVNGEMGYYIPYIYVTNDAAMAAGRELAGAPKKMADIKLETEYDMIQATLERPSGKRLITLTFKPVERATGSVIETYLPYQIPLLSIRHLPWVRNPGGGPTHLTQLISWYAEVDFHIDPKGEKMVWMGPTSITYDSPSQSDPVHKLKIDEILAGLYFQFDMKLNIVGVQKDY